MTVYVDRTADPDAEKRRASAPIDFFCSSPLRSYFIFTVIPRLTCWYESYEKPVYTVPAARRERGLVFPRDRDDTGVWRHTSLQLLVYSLLAARAECLRPVRHTSHVPLSTARHSAGSTDATRSFASHGAFGLRICTLPSPMSNVARGSAPIICA